MRPEAAGTIAVSGALARKAGRGGHTWVLLQYLLGFRRLGWDVLFVDRLDPEANVEAAGPYFIEVMERFGLLESAALLDHAGRTIAGLPRPEVDRRMASSAALINVSGYLEDPDLLGSVSQRVFLDIDPGFPQMWKELGLADPFAGHGRFVTVGRNVGREGCAVPDCGLDWITIPPPVVLEHWPVRDRPPVDRVTSVATWRGAWGPVEYRGTTFGLRVHEFRRFADVPRAKDARFELALDADPADHGDVEALRRGGWSVVDPVGVAGDPDAYRRYIAGSSAELMVAKQMYVRTGGGWFSDRSACYLASGRPVVAQDTGLDPWYPTDKGVVAFSTPEEAVRAVREVFADHEGHARAARLLAEEVFDSDLVLSGLLAALGLG